MQGESWHKRNPALLAKLSTEMSLRFPGLSLSEHPRRILFRGPFDVVDEGKTLDSYDLEVELPSDYPNSLPIVCEVGGRIPRERDRHVNGDGTLCVCMPEAYLAEGGTPWLPDYLQGPVRSFLIGNGIVERGGQWPWGEWEHGTEGMLAFYQELIGSSDRKTLVRYLALLARERVKGHHECPCGSGARLRNCHSTQVKILREKVPPRLAEKALAAIAPGGASKQ